MIEPSQGEAFVNTPEAAGSPDSSPLQPEDLGLPPEGEPATAYVCAASTPTSVAAVPRMTEATAAETPAGPQPFHMTIQVGIEGIEATQGTQFYKSSRHLHGPHAEPDNSVPLIKRKHLAIRVYPDIRRPWWMPSLTVDGEVWFRRFDVADTYKKAFRLNRPILGRRATAIDRGDANQTLNFRISDLYTQGRLVVFARVWLDFFGQRIYSDWFYRKLQFISVPPVRIRAHGVHYQRGTTDKPAPTLSDFIATGVYLRKTYPMSRFNFVSYDVINFGGNLTDTSGGGCGAGWNALWAQLRALYFSTGQDANHYALMQTGIPTAYGGCGGGNVGASFVGQGFVMAQELGHGLGRAHAPGCGAGGPDPNYPHYTHPVSASIGEYGMDYATGKVYEPSDSNDFMGYCPNPWVSPHTYRELINGILNQPTPGAVPAAGPYGEQRAHVEDHLYLSFRVSCEGKVELLDGFTLNGPPDRSTGKETSYSMEVQDGAGDVLWAKRLTLEEAHQHSDHSHTNHFEAIPIREGASRLVFRCGHIGEPTVIELPANPPALDVDWGQIGEGAEYLSGKVTIAWRTDCDHDEKAKSLILYSNDGGKTWRPAAIGMKGPKCDVDLDLLPGGDDCRLKVVASNVLRSTTTESSSFMVKKKPRKAMISEVYPPGERPVQRHVELAGCAYSPDGCCDEEDLQWFSSLEGYLGTGSHLIAGNLRPGEHVIALVAPDGEGGETRAEHRVRVLPESEVAPPLPPADISTGVDARVGTPAEFAARHREAAVIVEIPPDGKRSPGARTKEASPEKLRGA